MLMLADYSQCQGYFADPYCNYDAFIASTPINGKVFLFPRNIDDQTHYLGRDKWYCPFHCAEIVSIDSEEENAFFTDFMRGAVKTYLPNVACQRSSQWTTLKAPPCNTTNDLIFLLDSADLIGRRSYTIAQTFINDLAGAYTLHNSSRVGSIIVSDVTITVIPLTNTLSPSDMTAKIFGAPYLKSKDNLDLGIKAAIAEFNSDLRTVPLNLVILTDGYSTNETLAYAAAKEARDAGIRIFSVGIGQFSYPKFLLYVTMQSDRVFFRSRWVPRYHENKMFELHDMLKDISEAVCLDST